MTFREAVDQSRLSLAYIAKRGGWRLHNVKRWYRQGAPKGAFNDALINALDAEESRRHLERLGLEATPGRIRYAIGDRLEMVSSRGRIAARSGKAVASPGKRARQHISRVE